MIVVEWNQSGFDTRNCSWPQHHALMGLAVPLVRCGVWLLAPDPGQFLQKHSEVYMAGNSSTSAILTEVVVPDFFKKSFWSLKLFSDSTFALSY